MRLKLMFAMCVWVLIGCGVKVLTGESSMSGAGAPAKPFGVATGPVADGDDQEIVGTCELILPTQKEPRTCGEISLFIRNPADGQERRAEITGPKVRFTGLTKGSYRLEAASSKYDLQTNVKNEVTPGQTLKIRILAKPRS